MVRTSPANLKSASRRCRRGPRPLLTLEPPPQAGAGAPGHGLSGTHANGAELQGPLDENQLSGAGPGQLEVFGPGQLGRVAATERLVAKPHAAVEHVQVAAPVGPEPVMHAVTVAQVGDHHAGVLSQVQPVFTGGTPDLPQSPRPRGLGGLPPPPPLLPGPPAAP